MRHEDSLIPGDWIRIAEKDLQRVHNLLSFDDATGAGFYLQQSLEKFLKAYLLSRGWTLRKVHDLESILNSVCDYDNSFDSFRSLCQKVTTFYIVERYPFTTDMGIEVKDVLDCLDESRALIDKLKEGTKI